MVEPRETKVRLLVLVIVLLLSSSFLVLAVAGARIAYAQSNSVTVVCSPAGTQTDPLTEGSQSRCTATVTGQSTPGPTGNVAWVTGLGAAENAGFSSTTCALSGGVCSVTYTVPSCPPACSSVVIYGNYQGDKYNLASTGTFTLLVSSSSSTSTSSSSTSSSTSSLTANITVSQTTTTTISQSSSTSTTTETETIPASSSTVTSPSQQFLGLNEQQDVEVGVDIVLFLVLGFILSPYFSEFDDKEWAAILGLFVIFLIPFDYFDGNETQDLTFVVSLFVAFLLFTFVALPFIQGWWTPPPDDEKRGTDKTWEPPMAEIDAYKEDTFMEKLEADISRTAPEPPVPPTPAAPPTSAVPVSPQATSPTTAPPPEPLPPKQAAPDPDCARAKKVYDDALNEFHRLVREGLPTADADRAEREARNDYIECLKAHNPGGDFSDPAFSIMPQPSRPTIPPAAQPSPVGVNPTVPPTTKGETNPPPTPPAATGPTAGTSPPPVLVPPPTKEKPKPECNEGETKLLGNCECTVNLALTSEVIIEYGSAHPASKEAVDDAIKGAVDFLTAVNVGSKLAAMAGGGIPAVANLGVSGSNAAGEGGGAIDAVKALNDKLEKLKGTEKKVMYDITVTFPVVRYLFSCRSIGQCQGGRWVVSHTSKMEYLGPATPNSMSFSPTGTSVRSVQQAIETKAATFNSVANTAIGNCLKKCQ